MSLAVLADPDAHGVVLGRGRGVKLPRFLPPTVSEQIRDVLADAPRDGLSAVAVLNRLRHAGTEASDATVASLLYRMTLDGRAERERTSPRHPWRYRRAA